MDARYLITDFRVIRPKYEQPQESTLKWLAEVHARADSEIDVSRMLKHLQRFGCSPKSIAKRGHELSDFSHLDWKNMRLFNFEKGAPGFLDRTRFFKDTTDSIFERFYCEEFTPPGNLIHVTCSGYVSPSAAQRLVAARGWNEQTRVTHAYHMGCYAAFPALRMARGFVASDEAGDRADIVHTELCTIHLDPEDHSPEQLVVQSLFADGFVKYSLVDTAQARGCGDDGLWMLGVREEIVPETEQHMTWVTSDWGLRMTLSRDVPEQINAALEGFLKRLLAQAELDYSQTLKTALFAIHPGGPRIIDGIQAQLKLSEEQIRFSRQVLHERGNMSSATLPHVWSAIASAKSVARGTIVVSLAFGPGLTVCGGVFRKA